MDEKEFSERTSKIVGTTKVTASSVLYQDQEYKLHLHSDAYATDTGWVLIAKLVPQDTALPEFCFRWDHGNGEVDIDIFIDGKSRKDWDDLGYSGHHTALVNPDGREYEADIWIPGRQIFNGTIKVGLVQGLKLVEEAILTEHVDIRLAD